MANIFGRGASRQLESLAPGRLHRFIRRITFWPFSNNKIEEPVPESITNSPVEFVDALMGRNIKHLKPVPGTSTDWYACYKTWCARAGIAPAGMQRFIGELRARRGIHSRQERYISSQGVHQRRVISFGFEPPKGVSRQDWLTGEIKRFDAQARRFKGVKA